jgi:hypothetical protein
VVNPLELDVANEGGSANTVAWTTTHTRVEDA